MTYIQSNFKRWISNFLLVLFLGMIFWYLYQNRIIFYNVSRDYSKWFSFLLSGILVYAARGFVFKYQINMHGGKIGIAKAISDVSYTTILNSFLPSSTGSFYLVNSFSKATFKDMKYSLSAQALSVLLILWWAAVYTLCTFDLFMEKIPLRGFNKYLLIFVLSLPFIFCCIRFGNIDIKVPFINMRLSSMIRPLFTKNGFIYFCFTFLESVSIALSIWFCLSIFNVDPDPFAVVLISGIRNLSLFFSITPGSIGSSEAILYLLSDSIKISGAAIIATSVLLRAMTLVTGVICIVPYKLKIGQ